MYENSIANIILSGEEMKILPLKSRTRMLTHTTSI